MCCNWLIQAPKRLSIVLFFCTEYETEYRFAPLDSSIEQLDLDREVHRHRCQLIEYVIGEVKRM